MEQQLLMTAFALFDRADQEISSTDSDSSDEEILLYSQTAAVCEILYPDCSYTDTLYDPSNPNKILDYVENQVRNYDDDTFKEHFRVNKITANYLIDMLQNSNFLPTYLGGRKKIGAESYILITLTYMGSKEPLRHIAKRFGVSLHSVWSIIRKTIDWICAMVSDFIKWPSIENDFSPISEQFETIRGMKNVIGAIISTHIKMTKFLDESYINCQNENSLILQAVVTPDNKFTNIYCEEPGCETYSSVLCKSPLHKNRETMIPEWAFLLGNSAYSPSSWLVPPFTHIGYLSSKEIEFNKLHSETYACAEQAFDMLKSRFHRLRYFSTYNVVHFSKCVTAACILHNICISHNDMICEDTDKEPYIEEIELNRNKVTNDRRSFLLKTMKKWKK